MDNIIFMYKKPMKTILRATGYTLIESLFPQKKSCMFCGRFWYGSKLSAGLCPLCLIRWRQFRLQAKICPMCGSFDSGDPCRGPCATYRARGAQSRSLAAVYTAAPYTGLYRQRVMAFKYNGQPQLARPLAYVMAEAWREGGAGAYGDGAGSRGSDAGGQGSGAGGSRDSGSRDSGSREGGRRDSGCIGRRPCLVPVPMHRDKQEARGYNQSRLLAEALSRETGLVVAELLSRPRLGQMQAGLDRRERQTALDQVFQWAGPEGYRPGPVILVDDVITTGATLDSCGQILARQGCGPIWGLAFAGGIGAGARTSPAVADH